MKLTHRISSFLLALVLLFGCVSTSVFATDSAANEEEQANETAHTHDYSDPTIDVDGDKLCDACVAKQLDANKGGIIHPDDLKNYINDTGKPNSRDPLSDRITATTITDTSPYGFPIFYDRNDGANRHEIVTENGNTYLSIKGNRSEDKAVYTTSDTRCANTENFIKRFAERTQKSFVVTTDVKLHSTLTARLPLITLTSFMKNKVDGNPTTSTDLTHHQFSIVRASKDGKIECRNGENGEYITIEDKDKNLIGEDFSTISIHVRPEAGEFGLYDLYFDGELVKKDIQFLTETENKSLTWTYEGTEASGNYHLKNGQKVNGAKDYLIGYVYLGIYNSGFNVTASSGDADAVILSIDNTKVYFSEDYIECNHNFKIVGNHSHDLSTNEIVETFACHCGKELEVRLPLDTVTEGVCDTCGLTVKGNGIIHPDNLKNYINDTGKPNSRDLSSDRITATTITETSPYGFPIFYDRNDGANRHEIVTENGNTYLSIKGSGSTHKAVYTTSDTRCASTDNFIKRFAERTQKSFVVTTDVKLHSTLTSSLPLITLTSFMKNNVTGNPTKKDDLTHLQFLIVRASEDGKIECRNGENGKYITIEDEDKNLIGEDFSTISIHVRPEAGEFGLYDLYFGGELVKKDIQFLTETENKSLTWTYEGTEASGNYHLKNGQKVNGAKDYLIGYVYLGIYLNSFNVTASSGDADAVILSIDNTKVYFSEDYIECASHQFETVKHEHDYKTGELVDTLKCHCGATGEIRLPLDRTADTLCDECKEQVAGNITVVARQVFLDQLIGLKLYAYIGNEEWINDNNKAIFTVGDNLKTEVIPLSKAVKTDGLYEFDIKLTSIQMAENVTLGFEINGETKNVYTTSVKDYAETLIKDKDQTDKTRALTKALLNYGAAAQEYFAVLNDEETLNDTLANAGLADADKVVEALTAADLAAYKFSAEGMTDDVKFTGATLTFSSKTYMNVYFTASADATVKVNGKACVKMADDGQYCVTVIAKTPAEAMTAFAFEITDGETVATSNISVFTAVHAALSNCSYYTELVNLVTAYARYCEFAKAYVA